MDDYFLDSIDFKRCFKTEEDVLNLFDLCCICKKIPFPQYKLIQEPDFTFCKTCYFLNHHKIESACPTNKIEINLLNQLIISCKNIACQKEFNLYTLKEMVDHDETCEYNVIKKKKLGRKRKRGVISNLNNNEQIIQELQKMIQYNKENILNEIKTYIDDHYLELNNDKIKPLQEEITNNSEKIKRFEEKINDFIAKFTLFEDKLKDFEKCKIIVDEVKQRSLNQEELINGFINDNSRIVKDTLECIELNFSSLLSNKVEKEDFLNVQNKLIELEDYKESLNKRIDILKIPNIEAKINKLENISLSKYEISNTIFSKKLNNINHQLTNGQLYNDQIISYKNKIDNNLANLNDNMILLQDKLDTSLDTLNNKLETFLQKHSLGNPNRVLFNHMNLSHSQNIDLQFNPINLDKQEVEIICLSDFFKIYKNTVTLEGHYYSVRSLLQLKDGKLATGSDDLKIKIWDLITNKCINTITTAHKLSIFCLIQLNNNDIVSSSNGFIEIIDGTNYFPKFIYNEHTGNIFQVIELRNHFIASASVDKTIKIWDLRQRNSIKTILTNISIFTLIQLNDNRIAFAGCDSITSDYSIKFLNCYNYEIESVYLKDHSDCVFSLIELSDSRLASGSYDKTIKIWDLEKYNCIITLKGHNDYINKIIQISIGFIVSCSYDKTIKIWDLDEKICIQELNVHTDPVYSLMELKDGKIVSGSGDKTIKIYSNK